MNRLSFLKSLVVAPFAPLALNSQEQTKKESLEFIEGRLESCIPQWPYKERLFSHQQEIWEDYNRFERNLFIMGRGASKSWMSSRIASLRFGPEMGSSLKTDRKMHMLFRPKETIINEFTIDCGEHFLTIRDWEDWKITIFTGVLEANAGILKEISNDKKWNVKIFNCENVDPIFYDKRQLASARATLTDFDREYLCKF